MTPVQLAWLSAVTGIVLAVAGIYILAGIGWTLLAVAVPCLATSVILIRGLLHG
jgi:hypothetical protein